MGKVKLDLNKYVAALSLSALILVIGIFLGNYIAQSQLKSLKETQEDLREQLLSLDLRDRLITVQDVCRVSLNDILEDKINLGNKIDLLEKRLGKSNREVIRQKKLYQLIEIKTWLILEERREKCNTNFSIILFFYTNNDKDGISKKLSEDQGIVLNALYKKNPHYINTFAFDIHTKNIALNTLKTMYNISEAPTLIIDGKKYVGFKTLKELEKIVYRGKTL